MVRTALALVLSSLVVTASARAAEDVPVASPLAPATTTSMARVNPDLGKPFAATAAPTLNLAALAPRRPGALTSLYAGLIGLQAYDVYSTRTALSHGATEANPLMTNVVGNPMAFMALKAGMTAMTIVGAERMWRNHHRTAAIVVMVAQNGMMAWVAAHNHAVIGDLR